MGTKMTSYLGTISTAFALTIAAGSATAEDGLYFGVSLGYAENSSFQLGDSVLRAEGNDQHFGGIAGYRFGMANSTSFSLEATLDKSSGNRMTHIVGGLETCTSNGADWCEVDQIARVRGVFGMNLGSGYELLLQAGLATVSGLAEADDGLYEQTKYMGQTIGIGAQRALGSGTLRFELVKDRFDGSDEDELYPKTLEIISFRTVYTF